MYPYDPYQLNLEANIVKRKVTEKFTYVLADRTIFLPSNTFNLPPDTGTINDIPVLNVYSENNSIIHVLERNPDRSRITMKIDFDRRYYHLKLKTAEYLLKITLRTLYGITDTRFTIQDSTPLLEFECRKPHPPIKTLVFNLSNFCNDFIGYGLDIRYEESRVTIGSHYTSEFYGYGVSNTSELNSLQFLRWQTDQKTISLTYNVGEPACENVRQQRDLLSSIQTTLQSSETVSPTETLKKINALFNKK